MAIQIREPLPHEIASARQLVAECFAALRSIYRPTKVARLARAASSTGQSLLVAIDGGEVVGTVEFTIDEGFLRFRALAVKDNRRRQGVARGLVDTLFGTACQRGCRALRLFTIRETHNERVFEAMGFRLIAAYPSADYEGPHGDAVTEVEMERPCEISGNE